MNDDLDTNGKLSAFDVHCARQHLAREHAAFFPTRLALARWSCGASGRCEEPTPQRAAWFARFGREHQAWLDRGGFAQHEDTPPLRQPAMWQPPVAAPFVPPLPSLPALPPLAQLPVLPLQKDLDGDTTECGTCT